MNGSGTKDLKQLISLSFKIQSLKKRNIICQTIMCTNQENLSTKVTPVIDFRDEPAIQSDIPFVYVCQ